MCVRDQFYLNQNDDLKSRAYDNYIYLKMMMSKDIDADRELLMKNKFRLGKVSKNRILDTVGMTRNIADATPHASSTKSCSRWRSAIALLWDKVYFEICIFAVRMAIMMQSIPILNEFGRRLTMMSGNLDTNANLCLFLRQLYSRAPAPLTYDPQEIYFASMFLEAQYKLLSWIVCHGSWRLLPPLLRPLFKAYYGRARHAHGFIVKCIEKYEVEQIVILGAGFDSNAYRSRELRIIRDEKVTRRYVRVFEVDRPEVHKLKLDGLTRSMTQAEFRYYAEGVIFVVCNFGVDSLEERLLSSGFDPRLSTAILWEGVTYYLDRTALNATLCDLRRLFSISKQQVSAPKALEEKRCSLKEEYDYSLSMQSTTPEPTRYTSGDLGVCAISTAASAEEYDSSRESSSCHNSPDITAGEADVMGIIPNSRQTTMTKSSSLQSALSALDSETSLGAVYLFMDYMLVRSTLNQERMEEDRLWRLNNLLAEALGTRFITGFTDAASELEAFGWKCIDHITYEDVERLYFTNLPWELKVFEEQNTTYGHNEPRLNCVECVFMDRSSIAKPFDP